MPAHAGEYIYTFSLSITVRPSRRRQPSSTTTNLVRLVLGRKVEGTRSILREWSASSWRGTSFAEIGRGFRLLDPHWICSPTQLFPPLKD